MGHRRSDALPQIFIWTEADKRDNGVAGREAGRAAQVNDATAADPATSTIAKKTMLAALFGTTDTSSTTGACTGADAADARSGSRHGDDKDGSKRAAPR